MKKFLIIFVFSFSLSLLLLSFVSYPYQSNMSAYYPSPNGSYTKLRLINATNGPNENATGSNPCFCAQSSVYPTGIKSGNCDAGDSGVTKPYPNAGSIFTDPTTGFLEICKSDGSVASFPGSCFTRTGAADSGCPTYYQQLGTAQSFTMNTGDAAIESWTCCYAGPAANATIAKAGCFSTYSSSGPPASCTAFDVNAYDVGCDTISGSDINSVYKRNCCFNVSNGPYPLGASSTANGGCQASRCTYPTGSPTCGEKLDTEQVCISGSSSCGGTSAVGAVLSTGCVTDIECTSGGCSGATPCNDMQGNCWAMSKVVTTQASSLYPAGTTLYYCP